MHMHIRFYQDVLRLFSHCLLMQVTHFSKDLSEFLLQPAMFVHEALQIYEVDVFLIALIALLFIFFVFLFLKSQY